MLTIQNNQFQFKVWIRRHVLLLHNPTPALRPPTHVKGTQGGNQILSARQRLLRELTRWLPFHSNKGVKSISHSYIHLDRNALPFPLSLSNTLFIP